MTADNSQLSQRAQPRLQPLQNHASIRALHYQRRFHDGREVVLHSVVGGCESELNEGGLESLKERLLSACPSSCFYKVYLNIQSSAPSPSPVYLLKFWCFDQRGSLYDVTKVLCELEMLIQRVKVMPIPDGRVLDLFFIPDYLYVFVYKD